MEISVQKGYLSVALLKLRHSAVFFVERKQIFKRCGG